MKCWWWFQESWRQWDLQNFNKLFTTSCAAVCWFACCLCCKYHRTSYFHLLAFNLHLFFVSKIHRKSCPIVAHSIGSTFPFRFLETTFDISSMKSILLYTLFSLLSSLKCIQAYFPRIITHACKSDTKVHYTTSFRNSNVFWVCDGKSRAVNSTPLKWHPSQF